MAPKGTSPFEGARSMYVERIAMKNVLITIPANENHKAQFEEALEGGVECELVYTDPESVTDEQLANANAIMGVIFPPQLKKTQNLEWVQLNSAGFDKFVEPGVLPEGVLLTNATGAYDLAVGEHMMALTFALIRRFPEYARRQAAHEWGSVGMNIAVEGSTILVLGCGNIGGFYARKMHALGATVIGFRNTIRDECEDYLLEQHTLDDLDEWLPRADVVAMILPGGPATANVTDERRLRLMKPGAYLVNCGRGNSINAEDLKKVLADGLLGGVALDVTEPEPLPADDELWDIPRVFLTPHCAGYYFMEETTNRIVAIAADNLHAWTHGEPLTHVVNR